jgi:hypothetical protein
MQTDECPPQFALKLVQAVPRVVHKVDLAFLVAVSKAHHSIIVTMV